MLSQLARRRVSHPDTKARADYLLLKHVLTMHGVGMRPATHPRAATIAILFATMHEFQVGSFVQSQRSARRAAQPHGKNAQIPPAANL